MSALAQLDILGLAIIPAPSHRTPVRAHMRRVKGAPLPTGAELRDAGLVKATASEATKLAVRYVREQLVELYRLRKTTWPAHKTPYVNADDAARIIREWAECPPEIHAKRSQNWRGAVFRKGWERTGEDAPSLRKHMHATELPGWRPIARPHSPDEATS